MTRQVEKAKSVKRSVLAKWRDQIIQDKKDNKYLTELTDKERDIYCRGIVCGCTEITSTLSLQQIIKIIID